MGNSLERIRTIFLYGATLVLAFMFSFVIAGAFSGLVSKDATTIIPTSIIPIAFADVPPPPDVSNDPGDGGGDGGGTCP